MKKYILILTLFLISLSSCEVNQDIDPGVDPIFLDEVREVLKGELYTPEGKLKSENYFQMFHIPLGRMDFYYNNFGQLIVSIGFNADNDSSSVLLYKYDSNGNEIALRMFSKEEDNYILQTEYLKNYDENGRILSETYTDHNPIKTYFYHEDGFNYKILLGNETTGECYLFYPDDQKRNSSMVWGNCTEGDTPIMEYFYRYNDKGLLEAKETWAGQDLPKEDAFQYFYNDSGQLIEEKEYYPQWGFEPRFRKTYTYYP